MFQAPEPVVESIAPVPAVFKRERQWWSLLHSRARSGSSIVHRAFSPYTVFLSLSPTSSDTETHFPIVNGTRSRKGNETPTGSSRFRPVDEAGHVLDVHVERVMRASVARLVYEWRRTKWREKQLAATLLHLSHELQSCPSHGHTVTLLGLLTEGRGPIPAHSAIAGAVSRVGSLERSVEFHDQAILELKRQVSVVDSLVTKVKGMEQLLAQLQHPAYESKSLTVAELGMKLATRERDLQDFSTFVELKQLSMAKLHDDLEKRVLHVEQQVESRVTNLEQWSHVVAESVNVGVNAVEDRVTNLEQWSEDIAASLGAVQDRVEHLEHGW